MQSFLVFKMLMCIEHVQEANVFKLFYRGGAVVKHLVISQWTNLYRAQFWKCCLTISFLWATTQVHSMQRVYDASVRMHSGYCLQQNIFFPVLPQFEGTPITRIQVVKYNIQGEWHLAFPPIFRNPLVLMCRLYLQIYLSLLFLLSHFQ